MSTFSKQVEIKQERKEKDRVRKEKLAEYFFSLSNTILGSLIIAVIILLLGDDNNYNNCKLSVLLGLGAILFVAFGKIGNNILK